jgi:UDP-N-acetylglucosamine 4,6-dehydratase
MFDNKIFLITGGTGSFGQAVVHKLLKSNAKEIHIYSRDEKKQEDLRISLNNSKLKYHIGDVRDINSLLTAFEGIDYIFHAAALKQVPSCEFFPMEAIKTNILGTENVFKAASYNNVKCVVLLSTDKAVYPINAMGMSKALAEKIMIFNSQKKLSNQTIFCATRYGNVMCSRGSVIPLFVSQIINQLPLTVTDINMTRFLMTLDESVDLVFHAFQNAKQGDIYVQKSNSSTIGDLASSLIQLFNSNSNINIIGTRRGEKLYETLLSNEEMIRSIDLGPYFCIKSDIGDLNYDKYFTAGESNMLLEYNSHNTNKLNIEEIKKLLLKTDYIREQLND